MKRVKLVAIFIGKAFLSAILVFLILRKVDAVEVVSRVKGVGWLYPGAALVCSVVILFLAARRWQILSGGLLSYAQALRYTWIGMFYNAILPGAVSGDVAKGASLAFRNKEARVGELSVSIAMDRIIGLYALLVFFVVSCAILSFGDGLLNPTLKRLGMYGFITGATALLLGACGAALIGKALDRRDISRHPSNRIRAFFSQAINTLQLYRRQPRLLLKSMEYSMVIHCLGVMSFYLLIRGLGVDCRMMEVVMFYSIIAVLICLPVTISGLGLRDWFSLAFFQSFWGDGQDGVAFAWLTLILIVITAVAGGLVQIADLLPRKVTQGVQDIDPLEGEA
jgi:hypothetical protein